MKKVFEEVNENGNTFSGSKTIDEIIQLDVSDKRQNEKSQKDDDDTGRYDSIINFPNFLLHVLKLFNGDNFDWRNESEEIMDDKKLVDEFQNSHKKR